MIIINRKEIEIYYPITKENKVPVIILNTSHNEGKNVWESMREQLEDYLVNDIDILKLSRRILPKLKHYKLDNIISYYYLKKTYSIKRLYLNKPSV